MSPVTEVWLALGGAVLIAAGAGVILARGLGATPQRVREPMTPAQMMTQTGDGSPWWQPSRRRLIWQVAIVVLIGLFFGARFIAQQEGWIAKGSLDRTNLQDTIATGLSDQVGTKVTVTCPNHIPLQKNKIVDCVATNSHGSTDVEVTIVDLDGHYRYEPTDGAKLLP